MSVEDGTVSVTGPRVGILTYGLWIAAQVLILALIVLALIAAGILWDWRYLVMALALWGAHLAVGGIGAACLWEAENLAEFASGSDQRTSFPLSAVKRVMIGRGWARNGLWLVIPYVVPQIDRLAEGHAVSFEAPDGETGREAVYAFHMRTGADADSLAALLEGE